MDKQGVDLTTGRPLLSLGPGPQPGSATGVRSFLRERRARSRAKADLVDFLRIALYRILILVAALSAMPATAAPPRTETDCTSSGCHMALSDPEFVHELVKQGDCMACHQSGAPDGEFHPPVIENPEIGEIALFTNRECRPCHDDHQLQHGSEASGTHDCVDCHDPHAGDSASLLHGKRGEACLSCHADAFEPSHQRRLSPSNFEPRPLEAELRRHGVVAEDRCVECHLIHDGSPKGLLRGAYPETDYAPYDRASYSACLESCHSPDLVEMEKTTTATLFRNGDDNLHFRHVASPARGRSCRLCHAPHLARNRGLVRTSMPFGKERLTLDFSAGETGGGCGTSCHLPAAYDRELAIPSRMRVVERNSNSEKKR
jgi:predicted CXXCH cytochrome family protein